MLDLAEELGHLDHVVSSYRVTYYDDARQYQRKKNKPLLGVWPDTDDPPNEGEEIIWREWLDGVLKHHKRKAA